jgi:hypothetical protein
MTRDVHRVMKHPRNIDRLGGETENDPVSRSVNADLLPAGELQMKHAISPPKIVPPLHPGGLWIVGQLP